MIFTSPLDMANSRAYIPSCAGKQTGAGIAVLFGAAMSRTAFALRLFCRLGAPLNGRPGGRGRKTRRCSNGTATPVSVAHPIAVGSAVKNRNWSNTMANIAQGASASIHPSVFTTRESSIIKKALNLIESKRLRDRPVLHYYEDFERYLMLRFAGLTNEQGHVLYLNINRELLAAEAEFFGHQSGVSWDMRKVVLRAINLGAEYVVFAHNHPNENPIPSDADLEHLKWSENAVKPLNIGLLDSYVVTSKGITSIKNHRQRVEESKQRERMQEYDRLDAERRAKRQANKAAKLAAQLEGAAA